MNRRMLARFQRRGLASMEPSTRSSSKIASRTIMRPNARIPTSKALGGGGFCKAWAMVPSCARAPVATTSARAVPLTTDVPMNTRLAGNMVVPAGEGTTSFAAG